MLEDVGFSSPKVAKGRSRVSASSFSKRTSGSRRLPFPLLVVGHGWIGGWLQQGVEDVTIRDSYRCYSLGCSSTAVVWPSGFKGRSYVKTKGSAEVQPSSSMRNAILPHTNSTKTKGSLVWWRVRVQQIYTMDIGVSMIQKVAHQLDVVYWRLSRIASVFD